MSFFKISRQVLKHACFVYKTKMVTDMVRRRLIELKSSRITVESNNMAIENVNHSFRTNTYFGKPLIDLIAEMVTDPRRPRLYTKTV